MGYAQLVMLLINMGMSVSAAHQAATQKMQAQKEFPTMEDPEMRSYLQDVGRQKQAFKTGTAFSQSLNDIKSSEALTDKGILTAAGGSGGSAITGLSRVHMSSGAQFGRIAEQGIQETNYLDQLYGQTLGTMSERRLGLQSAKYNQDMADAVDMKKKANANMMGGMNLFSTMLGSKTGS